LNPIYYIGQKVWLGRSNIDGTEKMPCPDCLGTGVWSWQSPGGEEGDVECPRCRGRKTLGLRNYQAYVRELTIGSVQTDTARKPSEQVAYMCTETGVGSGSVYCEETLFYTEEDATAHADRRVAIANANLDKAEPKREELRSISRYTMKDSMVKEAEAEKCKAERRLHWLLERICKLSTYNTVGGRFSEDDEFRGSNLEKKQIGPLQESLVWLDDYCADYLENWRNDEKECDC
jgi:hypothetical protein